MAQEWWSGIGYPTSDHDIGYPTGDHGGTLCIDSVTTQALEVYAKVWCVETAPMSVYLVFGLNGPA